MSPEITRWNGWYRTFHPSQGIDYPGKWLHGILGWHKEHTPAAVEIALINFLRKNYGSSWEGSTLILPAGMTPDSSAVETKRKK
jgi:hypothetical protein